MQRLLIALTLALVATSVAGFCLTSGPYHSASYALATAIGNLNSASVCVYGNNTALNKECPLTCSTALRLTWGDCYCRDPTYFPDNSNADPLVRNLNTRQLYEVLATDKYTKGGSCREWLQENVDWKC